ncbi:cell division protein FtsL [Bombilactobacillus folatiphilus]|uniref:Cell division protein FtsL n=1 Tax=Bombilactobacillus folatiphilus TaxID=2923362 RepID=A0ABY4PAD3_9LACO|nr:cell division protein FtsL [Bombilactobacillus folatiphilus]UQS82700.1 cell division protein FtsL [Bombilactobacillus folatiphilus]
MEQSTVRKISSNLQEQSEYSAQRKPVNHVQNAVALNTKSVPFSGFEKLLSLLIGVVLAVTMFVLIDLRTQTSIQQRQIQDAAAQTQKVTNDNNNLHQEIIELSNSGRLLKIAQKHGLKLQTNNVRNISK